MDLLDFGTTRSLHNSAQKRPLHNSGSSNASLKPSYTLLERVQNVLRQIRDKLFSGFLTIDSPSEQQKLKTIVPIISQLEAAASNKVKAKQIVDTLPPEARNFVEIGVRKLLLSDPKRFKTYPHAHAFLEDRPHAKEVLELLRQFANSRREIVALAHLIPHVQDRTTSLATLAKHFEKLPETLRNKILLTMAKIDVPSKATIAQGHRLLLSKAELVRTAVATAVLGLKMGEKEEQWADNAWRCRFWYA